MTLITTSIKDITKAIIDPVCGMNVPFGKIDLLVKYRGCDYYFCAETCRKAFEKNPQKYLETKTNKNKGWWGRYVERLNKTTEGKPLKCH